MASGVEAIEEAYRSAVSAWRAQNVRDRDSLEHALDRFRIRYAYHSGRIENRAITYHDTRSIFEEGRAVGFTGDVRALFEIQNLKECHELLLDSFGMRAPIDEPLVLAFHRALTQGTYDERRWKQGERPGEYKRGDYVVGARDTGALAADTPMAVNDLLAELDVVNEANALVSAAYFHLALEAIHPFADGNGRCGRALMNYLLVLHNHPPIIVFDDDKMAYYGAMEVWDAEGDLAPMTSFLKAECVKTWAAPLRKRSVSRL